MKANEKVKDNLSLRNIVILVAVFAAALLFLRIATVYKTCVDSDQTNAVLHAKEILRTRSLFPGTWHGQSFFTPFDFMTILPLLFTADWTRAKMLAGLFMTACFILALWCFTSKGLRDNRLLPYLLIVFCSPIAAAWEYVIFQIFSYTHYFIFSLISLAVFFDFVRGPENSVWLKNKKLWLLSMVLFFSTLFGGIRVAQQIVIPAAASILVIFIYDNGRKSFADAGVRNSFSSSARLALVVLVAGGIGTIIGEKVLNPLAGVPNVNVENATTFFSSYDEALLHNTKAFFGGLISDLGIPANVSMFSFAGLIGIGKCFFLSLLVFVFPTVGIVKFKLLDRKKRFLLLFSLINFAEVAFILLLGRSSDWIGNARYLLSSVFFLALFSIVFVFDSCIEKGTVSATFIAGAFIAFALLSPIQSLKKTGEYRGGLSQMRALPNFLADNGLVYGYATYWNAYSNTFLSSGKVRINGVVIGEGRATPYLWSSSEDWYRPDFYSGRTFLMLTEDELNVYTKGSFPVPQDTLSYAQFTILVYEDNLMKILANAYGKFMESGEDIDGTRYLYPQGFSFGPYWKVDKGRYKWHVSGLNLDKTEISVWSSGGAIHYPFERDAPDSSESMEIAFELPEDTADLELYLKNVSDDTVQIKSIVLENLDTGTERVATLR